MNDYTHHITDVNLSEMLAQFSASTEDLAASCRSAYNMRTETMMMALSEKLDGPHHTRWYSIRHLLGLRILGNPHLKPFIHAEVLLADHIFINNLPFVRDDRYIGCSKPMCYHCQIYLELHPGNFCSRPCHGNLWLKWSPGALSTDVERSQTLRERMIGRIHRDAEAALMGERSTRRRLPDSTSGLSCSVII